MTSTKIYGQYDAHFANVSAFVIMEEREGKLSRVASIAIRFPKDGACRLYAYVHWFGLTMVRGSASGYGYDKKSAACASAAEDLTSLALKQDATMTPSERSSLCRFIAALGKNDGYCWDSHLRDAGFEVLQAV